MDRKTLSIIVLAALLALVVYLVRLWQPERQVRLHTEHLLKAVEGRRWKDLDAFVADNYSDRWSHDKVFVLRASNEVFSQFLFLSVQSPSLDCAVSDSSGTARGMIKIGGNGGPLAQAVMERVSLLHEPCVFTWQRMSWKPWDWRLVRFDQSELQIPRDLDL